MRERLAALSPGARATLLPIAALAQPLALLREAATDRDGVQEAVQVGVLVVDGERVRFAHPLLGSLVYGDASDAERQTCTSCWSRWSPTGRSTQCISPAEPWSRTRTSLPRSRRPPTREAWTPRDRGRARRAQARLTPAVRMDDRARRVRETARFLLAVGDAPGLASSSRSWSEQLPASEERARALGPAAFAMNDTSRSIALLEDALAEAERISSCARGSSPSCAGGRMRDRWDAASRRGREAVELAERSGSRAALAASLGRLAWSELFPGGCR